MSVELGRISGALLKDNLLRHGVDLAFENDLLYLDVGNQRIGIRTDAPSHLLSIDSSWTTTNLKVDLITTLPSITIQADRIIDTAGGTIIITPSGPNPIVQALGLGVEHLRIRAGQEIENITPNSNIEIVPYDPLLSTTTIDTTTVEIFGNLHATGDITADGNITFGSDANDTVDINAEVASNIVPDDSGQYDLGSGAKRWSTVHTVLANGQLINTASFIPSGIDMLLRQGNTIYVATTGSDTLSSGTITYQGVYNNATAYAVDDIILYSGEYYQRVNTPGVAGILPTNTYNWIVANVSQNTGTHLHSPFNTITKALSVAVAGDEIVIFPGNYQEVFPMTVPAGVAVRGASLRAVNISPTPATDHNDAFLLNGDTTVEQVTVRDFYYDSVADTGYAFRFAQGMTTSFRSPYVQNVTVLTKGSVQTVNDPTGFNAGDAGRGALVDGGVASAASKDAAMLFHAVTFICHGANGLTITNGSRAEWLNSFTYFADKGIDLIGGNSGFGDLETATVITSGSPGETWAAPRTLAVVGTLNGKNYYNYYDEFIEWTGTFWKYYNTTIGSGSYYQSTDNTEYPWQADNWTAVGVVPPAPTFSAGGVRTRTEMRSINSANVYGNYGIVGDGADVLAYIIGHNFGYIGSGADGNNDYGLVVQANEIVAANGAEIYFDSMDHKGDFRVGNIFFVEQSTGNINFDAQAINFGPNGSVVFEDLDGITSITAREVRQDNIEIAGNTIRSLAGNINFSPASTQFNIAPADFRIDNGVISITETDSNLNLITNGTGSIEFEHIKLKGTTFTNSFTGTPTHLSNSILLSPNGTGSTVINTDKSLVIPYSNDSIYELSITGEIRQNTVTKFYEGWQASGLVSFYQVFDDDRNTYITPELTPNANDGVLRFVTNNKLRMQARTSYARRRTVFNDSDTTFDSGATMFTDLSGTGPVLTTPQITIDNNVTIRSNKIYSTDSSEELYISPNGTGTVEFAQTTTFDDGLTIFDSNTTKFQTITAPVDGSNILNVNDDPIQLTSTGIGYWKVATGGAVAVPYGNDLDRHAAPIIGMIRYNNDPNRGYLELYAGPAYGWINSIGTSGIIDLEEVNEIMGYWDLILG